MSQGLGKDENIAGFLRHLFYHRIIINAVPFLRHRIEGFVRAGNAGEAAHAGACRIPRHDRASDGMCAQPIESDFQPVRETLQLTQQALGKNEQQIGALVESISSGNAQGALWKLLSEKATHLNAERERFVDRATPPERGFAAFGRPL